MFPITLHKIDYSVDGFSYFIEYAKLPFLVFSIGMALLVLIWRLHSSHRLAYENELKQKSSNIEIKTNIVLVIDKLIESKEFVSMKSDTLFLLSNFARIYPLDAQLFHNKLKFLDQLKSLGYQCAWMSGEKEFFNEFYALFGLKKEENKQSFYVVVRQFNSILENTYQLIYGGACIHQLNEDGYNCIGELLDEYTKILTSEESKKSGNLTSWEFFICYEGLMKLSAQDMIENESVYYTPIEMVTLLATFTILPCFIQKHCITDKDSFTLPGSYFVESNESFNYKNIAINCSEKASKLLCVFEQRFRAKSSKY